MTDRLVVIYEQHRIEQFETPEALNEFIQHWRDVYDLMFVYDGNAVLEIWFNGQVYNLEEGPR